MRVALIIGAALIAGIAQAAETTIITLSCDGTITDARGSEAKPEPISKMGMVVNLATQTVAGFGGLVAHIDKADAAGVSFSGQGTMNFPGANGTPVSAGGITVIGDIDRVTGAVSATTMTTATTFTYELLCKPATRLF
jgi:hypothetical protein